MDEIWIPHPGGSCNLSRCKAAQWSWSADKARMLRVHLLLPYQGNFRVRLTFTLSVLDMSLLIVFNCDSLLFIVIRCYSWLFIVIYCILLLFICIYWYLLLFIVIYCYVSLFYCYFVFNISTLSPRTSFKALLRCVHVLGGLGKSSLEFATKNRRT